MSTPIEITVTLKNEHVTFKKKFLEYREVCLHESDPLLKDFIDKTRSEFVGEVSEVIVTTRMQVQ
jgi:hypothetical protein